MDEPLVPAELIDAEELATLRLDAERKKTTPHKRCLH